jgi:uncharacterized protein
MQRKYLSFLDHWLKSEKRKPLVVRGARQVGKTWLVRDFVQKAGKTLVEINLEKKPGWAALFESNEPAQILLNLSSAINLNIDPATCVLFLDEIQAVPELLAKLRWFAEDMPQLPVIAAGSLLEFVLEQHTFSMPVGRIGYMHMEPFSFEEFLMASDQNGLLNYLNTFHWEMQIPESLHHQLIELLKEYIIVGGMPEAIATWLKHRSLQAVSQVHHDLIATYRDDFNKYAKFVDTERLDAVMTTIPECLGERIVYKKINPDIRTTSIKEAFDLLRKARVCHRVTSCEANGIPLGSGVDIKFYKAIFLDVGLCSAVLKLRFDEITRLNEIIFINSSGIAEQLVGQQLRTIEKPYIDPQLYYWVRKEAGSAAEVDYVVQYGHDVVPLEVKAGSTGSLKSLHLFMGLKKLSKAVRINSDFPRQTDVKVKDQKGNHVEYKLYSIPFYLLEQMDRLIQ